MRIVKVAARLRGYPCRHCDVELEDGDRVALYEFEENYGSDRIFAVHRHCIATLLGRLKVEQPNGERQRDAAAREMLLANQALLERRDDMRAGRRIPSLLRIGAGS